MTYVPQIDLGNRRVYEAVVNVIAELRSEGFTDHFPAKGEEDHERAMSAVFRKLTKFGDHDVSMAIAREVSGNFGAYKDGSVLAIARLRIQAANTASIRGIELPAQTYG